MSQSLASILVHLVFSTKDRQAWLDDDARVDLHAYVGGVVARCEGTLLKAGSVSDHVHLLLAHPRTCAPARLVQEIKTASSRWLKARGRAYAGFGWQGGYGIFSISPGHRCRLETYLDRQAEHHREIGFQEEFRKLLVKNRVPFDERYVWD